jgi:hypothetical protein
MAGSKPQAVLLDLQGRRHGAQALAVQRLVRSAARCTAGFPGTHGSQVATASGTRQSPAPNNVSARIMRSNAAQWQHSART